MTAASLGPPDTGELPDIDTVLALDETVTAAGVCVQAAGEVDTCTAPRLQDRLEAHLVPPTPEVVLDLTRVTFLDSAGLCVLALAHKQATATGVRLRVLATTRAVVRPMQVTGLWDLLHAERAFPGGATTAL
jgi:anti-sigma B factor antagonist